jgi:hypothetical protein
MLGGEILQVASPREIYDRPAELRVARFIGSPRINELPAVADAAGRLSLAGRPLPLRVAARGPVTLALRPEQLRPAAEGLTARLLHAEFLGEATLLHCRLDGVPEPVILRAAPGVAPGDTPDLLHTLRCAGLRRRWPAPGNRGAGRPSMREAPAAWLLTLPAALSFALLLLLPTLAAVAMAFSDFELGTWPPVWIGLGNFAEMWGDRTFRTSFVNTLLYVGLVAPASVCFGLAVALLIEGLRVGAASSGRCSSCRWCR